MARQLTEEQKLAKAARAKARRAKAKAAPAPAAPAPSLGPILAYIDKKPVRAGDWVCFKSGIEQTGQLVSVQANYLCLKVYDEDTANGYYETFARHRDCWID